MYLVSSSIDVYSLGDLLSSMSIYKCWTIGINHRPPGLEQRQTGLGATIEDLLHRHMAVDYSLLSLVLETLLLTTKAIV
jgi:hypothetical protein